MLEREKEEACARGKASGGRGWPSEEACTRGKTGGGRGWSSEGGGGGGIPATRGGKRDRAPIEGICWKGRLDRRVLEGVTVAAQTRGRESGVYKRKKTALVVLSLSLLRLLR